MTSTVYMLGGAFTGRSNYMATMLGGAITNGNTPIQVPYDNGSLLVNTVEQGAELLNNYLTAGTGTMVIFGHGLGAAVISYWLSNYAADTTIEPADLSAVLIGNLVSLYGGAFGPESGAIHQNWFGDITAPANTAFAVADIKRQYDGWTDYPTGTINNDAQKNALAGQALIYPNYQNISPSPTAAGNVAYTPEVGGSPGNITYIWNMTEPVPLVGTAWDTVTQARDEAIRPTIEDAYNRPVTIPAPSGTAGPPGSGQAAASVPGGGGATGPQGPQGPPGAPSLAGGAILTSGAPTMETINTYNANTFGALLGPYTGAYSLATSSTFVRPLMVPLPPLASLSVGASLAVEKWLKDTSSNQVIVQCAGSDVFDGGATEYPIATPGQLVTFEVISRDGGATKVWKVVSVAQVSPTPVTLPAWRISGPTNPSWAGLQDLSAPQVAAAYQLPDVDGTGVTIGCLQLGGIPDIPTINAYCNFLGIENPPTINIISLAGAITTFSNEAQLDLSILASMVPGATINIYSTGGSQLDFIAALQAAIAGGCDLISCSWLFGETTVPAANMAQTEETLRAARANNVSFFVSSGDHGSDEFPWVIDDIGSGGYQPAMEVYPDISFPACCPSAVSVGATQFVLDSNGIRVSETAVGTTPGTVIFSGGGYSQFFPGTQCPVVSAMGYYEEGYLVPVPGGGVTPGVGAATFILESSTSGSCQFMAATHARLIQVYGQRFDFMNFALANPGAFFDVTEGTNGAYNCTTGRDLVTGIGTPNGPAMVAALSTWSPPA